MRALRRAAAALLPCSLLGACAGPAPAPPSPPLVIAHRGASGERPEHTLAAYRLAIEQGADFIEIDLVATRDGRLVCRHENELSLTTDIARRPEFATRRTTRLIDGVPVTGWFSEDLTLAELKTLRAVERIPELRPESARYDGRFEIPTLDEVIALVQESERRGGPRVGLYPELKHPTWFASRGISLGESLVATLVRSGFTDPERVFIQSFEVAPLLELQRRILPAAGVDLPLVQLLGALGDPREPFLSPADFRAGLVDEELSACLGEHAFPLGYADLVTPRGLRCMRQLYAEGIGPYKETLLERKRLEEPVDLDGDGRPGIHWQQTGRRAPWLAWARTLGLAVHPYTLRMEEPFRSLAPDGQPRSHAQEIHALLDAGATGFFTDHPGPGVAARDAWLQAGALPAPRRPSASASPQPDSVAD